MNTELTPPSTSRGWLALWLVALSILAFVMLGLVAWLGWRGYTEGLAIREDRQRQAAAIHLSRADALSSVGDFSMAEQELIEALRLAPDYPAAQERLSRLHQTSLPTPTLPVSVAASTPVPSATPTPAPTATPSSSDMLAWADEAEMMGEWTKSLAILEEIRARDAGFAPEVIQDRLLRAYIADGYTQLAQDKLEAAIGRFEAALQLDPENLEATEQRDLARHYLEAMTFWDRDWREAAARFEELYLLSPGYRDVTQRLALVYVIQGDRAVETRLPCDATEDYARALVVVDSEETRTKLTRARQSCLGLRPPAATVPPAPRLMPRILSTQDAPGPNGQITGRVLDRQGRPMRGYLVTLQSTEATRRATTDSLGQFTFDNILPADYSLDVPAGIGPALPVRLEAGKQVLVEFVEP